MIGLNHQREVFPCDSLNCRSCGKRGHLKHSSKFRKGVFAGSVKPAKLHDTLRTQSRFALLFAGASSAKERRPVGASDDPRHPAVKPCERLSERAEWRRARAAFCLPPAPPRYWLRRMARPLWKRISVGTRSPRLIKLYRLRRLNNRLNEPIEMTWSFKLNRNITHRYIVPIVVDEDSALACECAYFQFQARFQTNGIQVLR